MNTKPIDQWTDLELTDALNQTYQQLMQQQQNLQAINAEIAKRKGKIKPVEPPKKE